MDTIDREKLGKFLASANKEQRNAFLVVVGPNGSGRTAFARYVCALYAELNSNKKFVRAEHDPKQNVSTKQVLLDLLSRLVGATRRLGPTFSEGPAKTLTEELKSEFGGSFEIEKQNALESFSQVLNRANGAFCCILENIPTREMLTATHTIFERSNSLVVCTVTDQQREEVASAFLKVHSDTVMELRLCPLPAASVFQLASHRWEKWGATMPLPFERSDLEANFESPQRTVGRVLSLLSGIFEIKLVNNSEGDPWPVAELKLTGDQIKQSIKVIEKLENK
ncbi:hypothetical protein ACH50O_09240 [Methylomonas sp. 2BW1-5-20]|uniref:hypothetical protein n=1 Tax=Methylomonas sp. 2BW1-5-20 TaxID=3376686 RepID=UPI004050A301